MRSGSRGVQGVYLKLCGEDPDACADGLVGHDRVLRRLGLFCVFRGADGVEVSEQRNDQEAGEDADGRQPPIDRRSGP